MRIHLKLLKSVYNSQTEHGMEMNLPQMTSPTKVQKVLEAHDCKPYACSLTLGILTANTTCCIIFLEHINEFFKWTHT